MSKNPPKRHNTSLDAHIEGIDLQLQEDGVYLTVTPKGRQKLDVSKIRTEFLKEGVVNADFDRIAEVIREATGEPERIGDHLERYDTAKDEYINVSVSSDGLHAFLSLDIAKDKVTISFDDVMHKAVEKGISYNMAEERIRELVEAHRPIRYAEIATGVEMIRGKDTEITYLIDMKASQKPLILEDGSVDFHRINLIKNVKKDQPLARKAPPSPGKDGITVRNEVILAPPGLDKPLIAGLNTYKSEDGCTLYAGIDGHTFVEDGVINVEDVLVIKGDVDYSTGDIYYAGHVIIVGDVRSGFKVESGSDILVYGSVEAAEVVSKEGSVEISKGVLGNGRGKVIAGKNIKADYVEEATLEAGRCIEITNYAMNSNLSAVEKVSAVSGRGAIIGGKVSAGNVIEAEIIGSLNTQTEVRIEDYGHDAIYEQILSLEQEEEALSKRCHTIKNRLNFLDLLKRRVSKFPPEKAEEHTRLSKDLQTLLTQLSQKKQDKVQFEAKIENFTKREKCVYVWGTLYPGVTLSINGKEQKVKEEHTRIKISMEYKEIKVDRL